MKTYPDDNYDNIKCKIISFTENYEDSKYCMWLEKILLKILDHGKVEDFSNLENKIKQFGMDTTYLDNIATMLNDKAERDANPFLKDYPLNLIDPFPFTDEEIRAVNEWEIHLVANTAKEFEKKMGGVVKSKHYKKFLKILEPYKEYFLEKTWNRLSESSISTFLSVRLNTDIEWYDCSKDNIAYDFNFLMWADKSNERFLDIDTNLYSKYWQHIRFSG